MTALGYGPQTSAIAATDYTPPRIVDMRLALQQHISFCEALLRDPICADGAINEKDPADLKVLASYVVPIALSMNRVFSGMAYTAGLCSSRAKEHATYVTDSVEGNLDWSIRSRADDIEASRDEPDPDYLRDQRLDRAMMGDDAS